MAREQSEIADLTGLRTEANVSQRGMRFDGRKEQELSREVRVWKGRDSKFVN
jgi:hypothetical protein